MRCSRDQIKIASDQPAIRTDAGASDTGRFTAVQKMRRAKAALGKNKARRGASSTSCRQLQFCLCVDQTPSLTAPIQPGVTPAGRTPVSGYCPIVVLVVASIFSSEAEEASRESGLTSVGFGERRNERLATRGEFHVERCPKESRYCRLHCAARNLIGWEMRVSSAKAANHRRQQ